MAEKKTALWKRIVGYAGFSLFALVAAVFLTFPYESLKERVRTEADAAGYFVRIGSLGPGFFSIKAVDLQLSRKLTGLPNEKPPEAVHLDSVSVGPSLFPLGISLSVKAFGGSVSAAAGGLSNVALKLDAEGLDLSKGNLKGFTGLDLAGKVDLEASLSMPKVSVGGGPAEPDLGASSGTLRLATKGLMLKGGVVNVTAEAYDKLMGLRRSPAEYAGQAELIPFDVPSVSLGEVSGTFKFDKGAGTAEDFHSKSADLEAGVTGTLKLAKRIEYSEPSLEVRFKPDPEFQKRLGAVGAGLAMIPPDPKDPNWRLGRLTGFLGRPNFR